MEVIQIKQFLKQLSHSQHQNFMDLTTEGCSSFSKFWERTALITFSKSMIIDRMFDQTSESLLTYHKTHSHVLRADQNK